MIVINRFWDWTQDADTGERVLYLDGIIASESWLDDDITPAAFKADLMSGKGDVTIWLNSRGGDCVAASQIYTMLMDYKGNVTIKIDGMAASAASVIAMAGTKVLMSPTAIMLIHNPMTIAIGDSGEMQKAIDMLSAVKDSIINAYEIKTGLSRAKLSHLMSVEKCMDVNEAVELGFADGVLEDDKKTAAKYTTALITRVVTNHMIEKIRLKDAKPKTGTPIESLDKRLSLITH